MKFSEKIRRWLDGPQFQNSRRTEETAANQPQDDVAILIAREIRSAMEREQFAPPGRAVAVPSTYVVYLSERAGRRLPAQKKQIVREWLLEETARSAGALSKKQRSAAEFFVELVIDATLPADIIRVLPFWENVAETIRPRVATFTRR